MVRPLPIYSSVIDKGLDRDTPMTTITEQTRQLENVGTAKIEVWRVRVIPGSKPRGSDHVFRSRAEDVLEVHEQAAKSMINDGVLLGVESVLLCSSY